MCSETDDQPFPFATGHTLDGQNEGFGYGRYDVTAQGHALWGYSNVEPAFLSWRAGPAYGMIGTPTQPDNGIDTYGMDAHVPPLDADLEPTRLGLLPLWKPGTR